MWGLLEKITTQVSNYSSSPGQVWYILVFGYRLVVITTLGGAVYGDEQGAFQCSVGLVGCQNMCYNAFAKISHLRFWAFQLIAITTPTIFFHFYSLHIQGQIEKIKDTEKKLKSLETGEVTAGDNADYDSKMRKDIRKLPRRRNQVGKFKVKQVYYGNEKTEILHTKKIKTALIVSLLVRLGAEMLFTYFGFELFNVEEGSNGEANLKTFLWMRVPAKFYCRDYGDPELLDACKQHFDDGTGYVPCWVSRPYEKTVFLRYMNILSFICMLITIFEVFRSVFRWFRHKKPAAKKNSDIERPLQLGQLEPPSFETVMKRSALGTDRTFKGSPNTVAIPPPASGSLFECVSVEELEKRDSKQKGKHRRPKEREDRSVSPDAPPYNSDDSFISGYSKKIRN